MVNGTSDQIRNFKTFSFHRVYKLRHRPNAIQLPLAISHLFDMRLKKKPSCMSLGLNLHQPSYNKDWAVHRDCPLRAERRKPTGIRGAVTRLCIQHWMQSAYRVAHNSQIPHALWFKFISILVAHPQIFFLEDHSPSVNTTELQSLWVNREHAALGLSLPGYEEKEMEPSIRQLDPTWLPARSYAGLFMSVVCAKGSQLY